MMNKKTINKIGFAAVFKFKSKASIFTAELTAILAALEEI